MGLSSKEVSSDDQHGSTQALLQAQTLELPKPSSMKNQQQLRELLSCPRCDSTNTKFCYYNNYNKLQPRHFCKACKRHWTKGGTLRNVPVGGGRKNRRLKPSSNATKAAAASGATARASSGNINNSTHVAVITSQQQRHSFPFAHGDHQKNLSDVLYQVLIHSPSKLEIRDMGTDNSVGSFVSSSLVLPQNENLNIPYAISTSSFNTKPSSISTSFQLSNVLNYAGENIEKATNIVSTTTSMPVTSNSTVAQPWQIASTISGMDSMTNYWNWDDFDSTDLSIPWDDSDIKP